MQIQFNHLHIKTPHIDKAADVEIKARIKFFINAGKKWSRNRRLIIFYFSTRVQKKIGYLIPGNLGYLFFLH